MKPWREACFEKFSRERRRLEKYIESLEGIYPVIVEGSYDGK